MQATSIKILVLACCLIMPTSCQTKQEGALEGAVTPPCAGVRIIVRQSEETICAVEADARDGKFRIALTPGRYDIGVRAPSSSFPVSFTGVSVEPGKTATLPPIEIAQRSGTATLSGSVSPGGGGTRITLLSEGKERASVNASPEGRYEFTALPTGTYVLQAAAPGYAGDAIEVRLADDRAAVQNMRLFYISPIEGVDWTKGTIHAKGRGSYQSNIANRTVMHEMARRAALSEAERNLLSIVGQIRLDPEHNLKSSMGERAFTVKVKGFLQGFRIVAERELDGAMEVEIEIPLTGMGGLSRYLSD